MKTKERLKLIDIIISNLKCENIFEVIGLVIIFEKIFQSYPTLNFKSKTKILILISELYSRNTSVIEVSKYCLEYLLNPSSPPRKYSPEYTSEYFKNKDYNDFLKEAISKSESISSKDNLSLPS